LKNKQFEKQQLVEKEIREVEIAFKKNELKVE